MTAYLSVRFRQLTLFSQNDTPCSHIQNQFLYVAVLYLMKFKCSVQMINTTNYATGVELTLQYIYTKI
jgi:hypothetical protein